MGRSKGALNRLTREAALMAREIVSDPEYFRALRARAIAGTLGPMEPVLWYFGYGKPKERVELSRGDALDLSTLSDEELALRAEALAEACREALAPRFALRAAPESAPESAPPQVSPGAREAQRTYNVERSANPLSDGAEFIGVLCSSSITADSAAQKNSCSSNELHGVAHKEPTASAAQAALEAHEDEKALRDALFAMLAEQAAPEDGSGDRVVEFPARSSAPDRNA